MFQKKRKALPSTIFSKNTAGFTLIELLIVIGILAILVTAVIIAIQPGRQFQQARNATRWSHMNAIANAVYGYVIDNGDWLAGCPPAYPTTTTVDVAGGCDDLTPTYLPEFPADPQGGSYRIQFLDANKSRIKITASVSATDSDLPVVIQ